MSERRGIPGIISSGPLNDETIRQLQRLADVLIDLHSNPDPRALRAARAIIAQIPGGEPKRGRGRPKGSKGASRKAMAAVVLAETMRVRYGIAAESANAFAALRFDLKARETVANKRSKLLAQYRKALDGFQVGAASRVMREPP